MLKYPRLIPTFLLLLSHLLLLANASNGRVLYVDCTFTDSNGSDGSAEKPFKTISEATALVEPGDTVYVMPGVYREHIALGKSGKEGAPITFEAAPGHQVYVRGSEVWGPQWEAYGDSPDVFYAPLDPGLFQDQVRNPYLSGIHIVSPTHAKDLPARPFSQIESSFQDWQKAKNEGRMPRTLGQLFVDSMPYTESESISEVKRVPGTWIVDPSGDGLIVHFKADDLPIEKHLVELSVRDRIFAPARRGLAHIVVRGFVFEHAANQGPFPQLGAVSLRSGRDWLVEDNVIRYAKTIGIDAGSETYAPSKLLATEDADKKDIYGKNNTIRNNVISDNGLCGLAGWHCYGIKIIGNTVERNNYTGFRPKIDFKNSWEEHGGIKLHGATNALIEGNVVRDNDAHGIWIDNGFTNARITRNVVLGNAGGGIVLELGNGPVLVDRNIVAYTRAYSGYYGGDGIYGHDASGITVLHNLCFRNTRFGIFFQLITDRAVGGKPAEASNIKILNNILFRNGEGAIKLPVPSARAKDNFSDYNVYGSENTSFYLTGNSGSIPLDKWQAFTKSDTHSIVAGPSRLILRPHILEFEVDYGDTSSIEVPAVTLDGNYGGGSVDFGSGMVKAGPWLGLPDGNQRIFLLPLATDTK